MTALLDVRNLHVELPTRQGPALAVRDLSFSLAAGDTLGLVGESGSGKSLTALAIMGLLPRGARTRGSVRWQGREMLDMDEAGLCALRGNRLAMVFQEPMTALNPVHSVGAQVAEPLRLHQGLSNKQARLQATDLLARVGIAHAVRRYGDAPHRFSGGQRQRILIAMALACGPELLLADEPTTALDTLVQQQILELLHNLVQERGMALLLVSHDLAVVARHTRRLLVMYGGTAVESGPSAALLTQPSHPYTLGLLAARPRLDRPSGTPLTAIAGQVPELWALPPGCRFASRCPAVLPQCASMVPPIITLGQAHEARCVLLAHLHGAAQEQPA
jgi:peptide/nickel transport system ATP-binding protein